MTTAELTSKALERLKESNFIAWQQRNIALYKRPGRVKKGQSDIIGYHAKTGCFLGAEVKNTGDTLKDEQRDFLLSILASGGFAFVVVPCPEKEVQFIQIDEYLTRS